MGVGWGGVREAGEGGPPVEFEDCLLREGWGWGTGAEGQTSKHVPHTSGLALTCL